MSHYLAFDLGAESGRAMLGRFDGGQLSIEEIHRFPNDPVWLPAGLYWDTLRLYHEIEAGLRAAGRLGISLGGIGIDTWGVDFGLLAADGALAGSPRHYRDPRNNGMLERVFAVLPRERIFASTGLQFMQLNSLYQWYAMKLAGSPELRIAHTLLFMPDLFHYFLTGVKRCERTIASTSQFYNPVTGAWAADVLNPLGLDASLLPEIVDAGAELGPLYDDVADRTGLPASTIVYATASHDTASAVAAVPAGGDGNWCYISSGTWSLMGVELDSPLINDDVLAANFTNEIGAAGRVRLLKNIAGLWLIQECRRAWALAGEEHTYTELTELAAAAPPLTAAVDPDAFLEPGHMPERIAEFCRGSGQPAPDGKGALCRVVFESLALRYRQVLENLEALTGQRIDVIHIVGGGSRNEFLNQLVADCTGRVVAAGPAEATAVGNVLVQSIGAGQLKDLAEARAVVRRSFSVTRYEPCSTKGWDDLYRRFAGLRLSGQA